MQKDQFETPEDQEGFSLEDILQEFGAPEPEKEKTSEVPSYGEPDPVQHKPQREQQNRENKTIPFVPSTETGEARKDAPPQTPAEQDPPEPKETRKRKKLEKPPKSKAVVPPETRYRRSLMEINGRRIRLILCWMLTALALVEGVFRAQGMLAHAPNQEVFAFGEIAVLILCGLCAYDVLTAGVTQIFRQGFGVYTLLLLEVAVGVCHGFMALKAQTPSYCPLICLAVSSALWGYQMRCKAYCSVMDVARKADGRRTLVSEQAFYGKAPGMLLGSGNMAAFLSENDRIPGPQKFLDGYALAVLAASVVGAYLTGKSDAGHFFQNLVVILLSGTSVCGFWAWSRPWYLLSKRLKKDKIAFYGWNGAKQTAEKLAVRISDEDLFPGENLKLNGIKYFGGANPERVAAYASAIIKAAGSGLESVFEEQVRNPRRYAVTNLRRYEIGGVSADIGAESVLVGSLPFVQSMGVEVPAGTKVSQAVYVAIDGDLVGVFAIHYGVHRGTVEAIGRLTGWHNAVPVVTAGDFMITESFLKSKFHINTDRIQLPSFNVRAKLNEKRPSKDAEPLSLIQDKPFEAAALCVSGAGALRTAVKWGTLISLLGSLMGMSIMLILLFTAAETVTLTKLLLFLLIWAIPGFLLSGWTKNI